MMLVLIPEVEFLIFCYLSINLPHIIRPVRAHNALISKKKLNGTLHPKIRILSLFFQPRVV